MIKKQIFVNLGLILCAVAGLWIVADHMSNFLYANYLNEHADLTTFAGVNIVTPWADLTFFTYITVIIFSFWCLGFGLSSIFSMQKLNNFLRKDSIICFIFCNYLLTTFLYTFFQIFEALPFGWFEGSPLGYHSLATSIILHYVNFAICCVIFAKIKTTPASHKNAHIFSATFLITYYTVVKLIGEFCYPIRYFPYSIFDAKTFGKTLGITNYACSVVVLIIACCIIFILYQILLHLQLKLKTRQRENST